MFIKYTGQSYKELRNTIHQAWLTAAPGDVISGDGLSDTKGHWDHLAVIVSLQDILPYREVIRNNDQWSYVKYGVNHGRYVIPPRSPSADHIIFIPTLTASHLLDRAVMSVIRPDLNIVVMDTSGNNVDFLNREWIGHVGWYQANHIYFVQIQNLMHRLAKEGNYPIVGYMHDDGMAKDKNLYPEVLDIARQRFKEDRVALIWAYYDVICAYNVAARDDVGSYDESFDSYWADADHHHRLKLLKWKLEAGPADSGWTYEKGASPNARVEHYESFSVKTVPEIVKYDGVWARSQYIHKWGGIHRQEYFLTPHNA